MNACNEGIVAGYRVVDVKIDFYDGKMHPVDSKDIAFQIAGYFAFKEAFMNARPCLLEPIHNVEVTIPEECMGKVMGDLSSRRGKIQGMDSRRHLPDRQSPRPGQPSSTTIRPSSDHSPADAACTPKISVTTPKCRARWNRKSSRTPKNAKPPSRNKALRSPRDSTGNWRHGAGLGPFSLERSHLELAGAARKEEGMPGVGMRWPVSCSCSPSTA